MTESAHRRELVRCAWGDGPDPAYRAYHDEEWGVPIRDERHLFELLVLEGAQAGLSWYTILRKRDGYRRRSRGSTSRPSRRSARRTSSGCSPTRASSATGRRSPPRSATRGRRWRSTTAGTTLVDHLWSFVGGPAVVNRFASIGEIPAETDGSTGDEQGPPRRGFRFVGPTICYALMQSAGLVNDHETRCFRWAEVAGGRDAGRVSGRAPGVAQLHPAAGLEHRARVDPAAQHEQHPDRRDRQRERQHDLPRRDRVQRGAQRHDERGGRREERQDPGEDPSGSWATRGSSRR